MIGVTIWLVQLNFNIQDQGERLSSVEAVHVEVMQQLQRTAIIQARTTAIQESLLEQLNELQQVLERVEPLIYKNSQ